MSVSCSTLGRACDGCMSCQDKAVYRCPICGEELSWGDQVFVRGGEVIGCACCIESCDAEDVL